MRHPAECDERRAARDANQLDNQASARSAFSERISKPAAEGTCNHAGRAKYIDCCACVEARTWRRLMRIPVEEVNFGIHEPPCTLQPATKLTQRNAAIKSMAGGVSKSVHNAPRRLELFSAVLRTGETLAGSSSRFLQETSS